MTADQHEAKAAMYAAIATAHAMLAQAMRSGR